MKKRWFVSANVTLKPSKLEVDVEFNVEADDIIEAAEAASSTLSSSEFQGFWIWNIYEVETETKDTQVVEM